MCKLKPDSLPFPFPLPVYPKEWLTANDGAVKKLAEEIHKEQAWYRMRELAEALALAGCQDAIVLEHFAPPCDECVDGLRDINKCYGGPPAWVECWRCDGSQHENTHEASRVPYQRGGCWEGECWLLNHLLDREQPVVGRWWDERQQEAQQAPVLNPGNDGDHVWFVTVQCGYTGLIYIVEERGATDAWDELAESEKYGHVVRIDESDYADYGFEGNPGDRINGINVTERCWINLKGEIGQEALQELATSGNGQWYSTDDLHIDEAAKDVLYFGPGLPLEGVEPENWWPRDCDNCLDQYFRTASWDDKDCCSVRCRQAWDESGKNCLVTFCALCHRNVDPFLGAADTAFAQVELGLHFPAYCGGDFAMPANREDETLETHKGVIGVCPGSKQLGRVLYAEGD